MGICASQDSKNTRGGRNTRKNNKKGGKGGKNTKQQRRRRHSTSEEESEYSESEDDDSKQDSQPQQQQQQAPVKINTKQTDTQNNYPPVSKDDLDILFYKATICTSWSQTPVSHEVLRNAMKLALLAPSAYNCCPMRVVFITSDDGRQKLIPCMNEEDRQQVLDAPVTAIVCTDKLYTRNLPKLMPYVPNAQQMFEQYEDLNEMIRIRNSNLQAGYLILALRSLGLAVGPICGLDNQKCDDTFLENTSWKSNLTICLGYANPTAPATPAQTQYCLPFDVAAKLIQ